MSKHIIRSIVIGLALLAAGCDAYFDDHRYETVHIPPQRLQEIEALDMEEMSQHSLPADANDVAPEAAPATLALTVQESRAIALENNLALKVQLYTPTIADQEITEKKAVFEPLAFSQLNFIKTDQPTSLELDASMQEMYGANVGVEIPLRTGGKVTFDLPFQYVKTNNVFSTLNPAYAADAFVNIEHPILRGAGLETNTHRIRIAEYESQIERARAKLEVITVLAAVDRVYWRLYAVRRELEVRRQEYDLAVLQQDRAQRMLEAEKAPEIEVIRAKAAVAERLEAIILAENTVRDRQRDLKRILNRPGLDLDSATTIIPTTMPNPRHYPLHEQKLMQYALAHRMELLELELKAAQDESWIQFARNGMLPLLSVSYTYNLNGLGPTSDDAYDLLLENRFVDHQVGLVLQLPLGNAAAKSRLRSAILTRQQRLAERDRRERLIRQEVLNAADQLEANWQRILASRKSAMLANRTLEAEQRHFELGLQNSTEVLDAQTKYADEQSKAIRAEVEYQIAQVDLAYATGSLLGAARVEWKRFEEMTNDE